MLARQFAEDGFVVVENFFDEATMASIEDAIGAYVDKVVPTLAAGRVFREPQGNAIKSMSAMDLEDQFLRKLKNHPRFLAFAAELLDTPVRDIVTENMQFFGKAAHEGSEAPWHQDNGFQNYSPPEACMFWLALDDVTEENGCVCFARGSHRLGLQPHRASGVLGFSMTAAEPDLEAFPLYRCVMPRGSLSVHHCNTFHCSGPNRSDSPRRSIAVNFRTDRAVADLEARARVKAEAAKLIEKSAEHGGRTIG